MPTLRIDLQEGFLNEPVIIRLDGREIYNETAVKTRFQSGFADHFECSVGDEPVRIEVELPGRKVGCRIEFRLHTDLHLGLSIDPGDEFQFKIWQMPFGYV